MTPQRLITLANTRKSVTGMFPGGRCPAAFVVSMQFLMVMNRLSEMKEYKPKSKARSERSTFISGKGKIQ